MKDIWILKAITWTGVVASLFLIFMAGAAMMEYGFGFILTGAMALGVAGVCYGGLYLDWLEQRRLTEKNREPFPKLDLA